MSSAPILYPPDELADLVHLVQFVVGGYHGAGPDAVLPFLEQQLQRLDEFFVDLSWLRHIQLSQQSVLWSLVAMSYRRGK